MASPVFHFGKGLWTVLTLEELFISVDNQVIEDSTLMAGHMDRHDINFRSFQQCVDLVVKDQQIGSSPVTTLEDGCIFHITCDKLHYLLCSTKAVGDESTVSAVVAVAFLEEFHRVIKDFCGSASEDGVRRNLLLLEEIMAEVINHGHIYTTELSSLRPCVYSEAAEITHPRNVSMVSSLASQVQVTDFVLTALVHDAGAKGAHAKRSVGETRLRTQIRQTASYSTDVVLSSYIIHDSVNMDSFSEHRTLVVRSPQGESAQKSTDENVSALSDRVTALEAQFAAAKALPVRNVLDHEASGGIVSELYKVNSRCDDAENRLRRSNLLFFGIPDSQTETWTQSEEKVIRLCAQSMGIEISPGNLERSHRLGKFTANKNRPIIVRFLRFKDK
ncbi:hypothetical protein HPB47_027082 [Ixodes persulcatus]|uniref:Uncharacterized protein n=1 Tax=Ixodes persulcatus TaxID=34615 RepID=A0AC60PXA9_IXOPE|nr:hypothetical protein HPB47_027082 [Ixodes persulcatus]